MISARILATSSLITGRRVSTSELAAATPGRDPDELIARTGIHARHWVDGDASVAGLGSQVLSQALAAAGLRPEELRRLILVSSTGGDELIPATANAVLEALGVANVCDGFDLNNACMGFLSAFDVAARTVATGRGPVAVVVVEMLSRFIASTVPRPYLVLGDAAAAVILGAGDGSAGVLGAFAANDGRYRGSVALSHPGLTGRTEHIRFADSNRDITTAAVGALTKASTAALAEAGLTLADMHWVVPHQPNGAMLDHLVQHLGVDPARLVRTVHEIGSVGAASIPVTLDRVLREHAVRPGHHVLMLGVGAGMAYGAVVYRVG